MESIKRAVQPMDLSEFKNLGPNMPTTEIDIPEKMENRVPTDKYFTLVLLACLVFLMPFLIYTLVYSDVHRLQGIDDCGNVCGYVNDKYDQWNCTGQDFTEKKYLKIYIEGKSILDPDFGLKKKCVEDCGPGYRVVESLCVSTKYDDDDDKEHKHEDHEFKAFLMYLSRGSVIFRLILCSIITVGVSIGVLYLFRYAVGIVVWSTIIGVFILTIVVVALMWTEDKHEDAVVSNGSTQAACWIGTIFLFIYAGAVYLLRGKIRLVILLLTETTNAVFAMPSLLVVPIFTFLAEGVIFSIALTLFIYMLTAGELTEIIPGVLDYVMTGTMVWTIFLHIIISTWLLYFISGFQYMVIGGAVSEWYFAKDKINIVQPIRRSANIAYKFHIGTVAFGSLIITIANLIRCIIKSMIKSRWLRRCVDFCLSRLERLLEFITKRAYIVTAMHGQPFLKSGKRAATLIIQNVCNITAVNFIGKLTLSVAKLLIALVSVLLSMLLFLGDDDKANVTAVLSIVFLMALFVGMTFFALFETTIDTIFICFCEDSIVNDGMARPYAMSKDLMEFVENCKKVYGEKQNYAQFDPAISQPV